MSMDGSNDMMRDEDPIARNPKDIDQPADENHRQASESNHSHETDRRRAHLAKALDTVHGMGPLRPGPQDSLRGQPSHRPSFWRLSCVSNGRCSSCLF